MVLSSEVCCFLPYKNSFTWLSLNPSIIYAMETYITYFLEADRFPKAPVLAGRKVIFTLRPVQSSDFLVDRVPPITSQCLGSETTTLIILSYLILSYFILSVFICIKIPMDLFFYMGLGRYDFDAGQRHYLGHWKGWVECLACFWPKFQGPKQAHLSNQPFQWPA